MKKKTGKRILLGVGVGLAVLLIAVLIGGSVLFGRFVRAANSVEKLEDGLYAMEFAGEYGFEEFLARGGAKSDREVADYLISFLSHGLYKESGGEPAEGFGCSTVFTQDESGASFFGRNYDWAQCRAMIVHTKPSKGYESISTCCLDFLGFGDDFTPDGSMMERMQSIAAIYVPLDGMNSEGLMVADLTVGDSEETHQQTGKTSLTTTTAIRLLLDRAANVEEAIDLLKGIDMNSSIGISHHLSIADASGRSVVVEYVNGEMLVADTRVVTNHYLAESEKQGMGSEQSHRRYAALAAAQNPAGAEEARDLLESVAQKNIPQAEYEKTMWSIVYRPGEKRADFYFAENFGHSYRLSLADEAGFWSR